MRLKEALLRRILVVEAMMAIEGDGPEGIHHNRDEDERRKEPSEASPHEREGHDAERQPIKDEARSKLYPARILVEEIEEKDGKDREQQCDDSEAYPRRIEQIDERRRDDPEREAMAADREIRRRIAEPGQTREMRCEVSRKIVIAKKSPLFDPIDPADHQEAVPVFAGIAETRVIMEREDGADECDRKCEAGITPEGLGIEGGAEEIAEARLFSETTFGPFGVVMRAA